MSAVTAKHDADELVSGIVPETHWTKSSDAPAASLDHPPEYPGSAYLVASTAYWVTTQSQSALDEWTSSHLVAGATPNGTGSGTRPGRPPVTYMSEDLGPAPGRYDQRRLLITSTPVGPGTIGIRVDAQLVWIPPRAPDEMVPDAITTATITASTGQANTLATRTVTDRDELERLRAAANELTIDTSVRSCPPGSDLEIALVFDGPTLHAPITVTMIPCSRTSYADGTENKPGLVSGNLPEVAAGGLGTTLAALNDQARNAMSQPPGTTG